MRNFIIFTALLLGSAAANAVPAVWESDFGPSFVVGDDYTDTVALGFAFPLFGTSYSSVEASTNGFLSFGGSNGSACCSVNSAAFLAGTPRLAVEWLDLATFVHLNTAVAGRAVFTWNGNEFRSPNMITVQAQLFADGRMILGYDSPSVPLRDSLTGLSSGGGAADPGGSNLNGGPFSSGGSFYQLFPSESFDLNQANLFINPRVGGGYDVSMVGPAVSGAVPEPASWAMLTIGFGLAGSALRRRRAKSIAA